MTREWRCNGSIVCDPDLDIHGRSCDRSNGATGQNVATADHRVSRVSRVVTVSSPTPDNERVIDAALAYVGETRESTFGILVTRMPNGATATVRISTD